MAETFQSNAIAAGHNNAAGLVNIETIADSAGRRIKAVMDMKSWRFGVRKVGGNGVVKSQGIASFQWVSDVLWLEQYYYIYTTILSSAISAPVTVTTRKLVIGTYNNYNAILTIPDPADIPSENDHYLKFIWQFTEVTAL
jgi:hypothetical protein